MHLPSLSPGKRFTLPRPPGSADALLLACPEYNGGVTGVLKNAIDWGSRGSPSALQGKTACILSATQGPLGGPRNQYDLRRILTQLWGHVMPRPEVFIGSAHTKFDASGKLTDETTRKFLAELVVGFKAWIERMQVKK